ncbi:hypothetical protein ACFQ21_01845 [Ohtaekwangia kribbensis]|uniref:Uncharacterized protein n=1 Tax=Ohtaekwangia kribbensis TaxID=688913 RepID=A0ABW3JXW8_9BACT
MMDKRHLVLPPHCLWERSHFWVEVRWSGLFGLQIRYISLRYPFFIGSNRSSILIATMATAIALSFLGWHKILVAENGRMASIVGLSAGYWLWVSSLLISMIGSIGYFRKR